MDAATLISKMQEFLEKNYYDQLLERIRKGEHSLTLEFSHLALFDPEIADMLLDQPEEVLKAGELAVEQLNLGKEVKGFVLRFRTLPASATVMIREITSKNLNKLLAFDGVVRNKSEVRPQVVSARIPRPNSANKFNIFSISN